MLLGISLLGLGLQLTSGAPTGEHADTHQTRALAPEESDQVMLMAPLRPPIQFVHMHKAGGTSFWHLAQLNGERLNELNFKYEKTLARQRAPHVARARGH